jgi:hypothetical protein
MAHTYPGPEFILVEDAFEQACSVIEDCDGLLNRRPFIEETKDAAGRTKLKELVEPEERSKIIDDYEAARRRVEQLMRKAFADGVLHSYIRAKNGQAERLVGRKEWRQEAFGIAGIENVPHHLTSPGPDTDGQPVFVKISEFEDWLARQTDNPVKSSRSNVKKLTKPIPKFGPRRAARVALDYLYPHGIPIDKSGRDLANRVNLYIKKHLGDLVEGRVRQEVSVDTVLRAAERK